MVLKFIGSGSAFNTKLGNNSAYYKFNEGKELLLIDCGTTTFKSIKDNNLLEGVEKVHVAITHTHDDHVGSLASLILYTYYSHGEFAKPKVKVYHSDNVLVNELLSINGCLNGVTYESIFIENGNVLTLNHEVSISFDKSKHVAELTSYGMELNINDDSIFYSGDINELNVNVLELIDEGVWDYFYVDTCKADYKGNVHLSLRELDELIPHSYRNKVYCMHLDEGFVTKEANDLGFNVVVNEF